MTTHETAGEAAVLSVQLQTLRFHLDSSSVPETFRDVSKFNSAVSSGAPWSADIGKGIVTGSRGE
jgi:hypothetical protein